MAFPFNRNLKFESVPRISSEDRTYSILNLAPRDSFIVPSQRRSRALKTYSSIKHRTTPIISNARNGQQPHVNETESAHLHLTEESHHDRMGSKTKMTVDKQADAIPVSAPFGNNRKGTDIRYPEKLLCSVSKADLERALAITPSTRRNDRRRPNSEAAKRPSRWATRTPNHRAQEITERPVEVQSTRKESQSEGSSHSQSSAQSEEYITTGEVFKKSQQQGDQQLHLKIIKQYEEDTSKAQQQSDFRRDSENLTSSEDSLAVDKTASEAQQNPQPLLIVQSNHGISDENVAPGGDLATIFEEGDENEKSAKSDSYDDELDDQDHELDEIDRQILHLGEVQAKLTICKSQNTEKPNARSPKRRRSSPERDCLDLFDLHTQNEEADREDFECQSPQKKRRTSRRKSKRKSETEARDELLQELKGRSTLKESQRASTKVKDKLRKAAEPKKRRYRRIPVDVIISERIAKLDTEMSSEDQAELPDDPITQSTASLKESYVKTNGKRFLNRLKVTLRARTGFGIIDTSQFRMPKVLAGHQEPSNYSDGFVGHETMPARKFMPGRKHNRRVHIFNKIKLRMRELPLVHERREEVQERNLARPRKESRKPNCSEQTVELNFPNPTTVDGGMAHEDDPMQLDAADKQPVYWEEMAGYERRHQQQAHREKKTAQVSSNETSVLELPSRSSLTQQQEQRTRTVSFKADTNEHDSQAGSTQSRGLFGCRESNQVNVSQNFKMRLASKEVDKPREKEIDVALQLMMVTIPRSSMVDSDSDSDVSLSGMGAEDEDEDEDDNSSRGDEERSETPEEDSGGEDDDESEAEVENGHAGMCHRNDLRSGPHKPSKHAELLHSRKIEDRLLTTINVAAPSLRREDAQNPILEMSATERERSELQIKSATSRSSSSVLQHQISQSDQRTLDQIHSLGNKSERVQRSTSEQNDSDDDSWGLREPMRSEMLIEVENDEILHPLSPERTIRKFSSEGKNIPRQLSQLARHALQIVEHQPVSRQETYQPDEESQGSVELGSTQVLLRVPPQPYVPEKQFSRPNLKPKQDTEEADEGQEVEDQDIRLSQVGIIHESSYFERVSQSLQEPIRRPIVVRTKSVPASMHTAQSREKAEFVAGGITVTGVVQQTVSPSGQSNSSSIPGHTVDYSCWTGKSLKYLTKQASVGLGTMPSSERKRMMSLPFHPLFKKQ